MKKVKLITGLVLVSLILSSCAANYVCPAYASAGCDSTEGQDEHKVFNSNGDEVKN